MTSYNTSLLHRLKTLAAIESDSDDDCMQGNPVAEARHEVTAGYRPKSGKRGSSVKANSSKGKVKLAAREASGQKFRVLCITMLTCGLTDWNELEDSAVPDKGEILELVPLKLAYQDLKKGIELDSSASADDVEEHFNSLFEDALAFQDLQSPSFTSLDEHVKAINHSMQWVLCTRKKGCQSLKVCGDRPDGALLRHVKDTSEKATWKESKIFLALRRSIDLDEYQKWLPRHIARKEKAAEKRPVSAIPSKRSLSDVSSDSYDRRITPCKLPVPSSSKAVDRPQENLAGPSNWRGHSLSSKAATIAVHTVPAPTETRLECSSDMSTGTSKMPEIPVTPKITACHRPTYVSPGLGRFPDPWDADTSLEFNI